jgi:hypothetical protein
LKRSNTPSNNAHLLGRAELLVLHVVLGVGSVFQTHIQRTLTSSALLTVVFVCRGCVCRISAALKVNLTMPFLTVLCMLRRLREYAVALKYALTTQYSWPPYLIPHHTPPRLENVDEIVEDLKK